MGDFLLRAQRNYGKRSRSDASRAIARIRGAGEDQGIKRGENVMSLGSILHRLLPKRIRFWLAERDLRALECDAGKLPQEEDDIPCIFVEDSDGAQKDDFVVVLSPGSMLTDKGLN